MQAWFPGSVRNWIELKTVNNPASTKMKTSQSGNSANRRGKEKKERTIGVHCWHCCWWYPLRRDQREVFGIARNQRSKKTTAMQNSALAVKMSPYTASRNRVLVFIGLALLLMSPVDKLLGYAGLEGTFEFACDAPWRIEPNKLADGTIDYGAIPIQISIHDAMYAKLDDILYVSLLGISLSIHLPDKFVSVGRFRSVRVKELAPEDKPTIEFGVQSLHEIEQVVGDWPWPPSAVNHPIYGISRVWKGDSTAAFVDVSPTSEWHASLWYVPGNKTPGTTVILQIDVVLQRDQWPAIKLIAGPEFLKDVSRYITLRNYVRVYLAPDPLPRFDNRWLYGDFHYHSQGTDNEGEFGGCYRGAVRAMGAMGMDFVFATDHASSSEQFVDADLPPVQTIARIADDEGGHLSEGDGKLTGGTLRDMDADRYAFCHELIYGSNGVNSQASLKASNGRWPQSYLSHNIAPQIFLGGEVDAIPEVRKGALQGYLPEPTGSTIGLPYGNGLVYDIGQLCLTNTDVCGDAAHVASRLFELSDQSDSLLLHDFQGLGTFGYYGREHVVYFPNSAALRVGNETSFVASYTSKYGGATRRLDSAFVPGEPAREPLLREFERKGVVFVAHHLNGGGGPGPDPVPWTTDHMLLKAFRSPAVLGMEFWNEDARYRTRVCSHLYCRNNADGSIYTGGEYGYERNETLTLNFSDDLAIVYAHANKEGFVTMLNVVMPPGTVASLVFLGTAGYDLIGGELLPADAHNQALPLEEFRWGFASVAPNGASFELKAFDVRSGLWQESLGSTEHVLVHGAYDWDQMNLRGLDFEHNKDLAWLKPGEPRRVFMGGGSDAHGEFNFHRNGYFLGVTDVNDTAIGKPRNLVFVGDPQGAVVGHIEPVITTGNPVPSTTPPPNVRPPVISTREHRRLLPPGYASPPVVRAPVQPLIRQTPAVELPQPTRPPRRPPPPSITTGIRAGQPPAFEPPQSTRPPRHPPVSTTTDIRAHSQEQVIAALRRGRFCVTDGPAIRIAIDLNANGKIDDGDIQMGDVQRLTEGVGVEPRQGGQTVTLLTEVLSTAEFGPIYDVDIYVGVYPTAPRDGSSGPVEPRLYAPRLHGPLNANIGSSYSYTSGDKMYARLTDNYWDGDSLGDRLTWNYPPGTPLRYDLILTTTLHLDRYEVGKGISANRFFVRAFARTAGDGNKQIPDRYAFSNPIWILRQDQQRTAGRSPVRLHLTKTSSATALPVTSGSTRKPTIQDRHRTTWRKGAVG